MTSAASQEVSSTLKGFFRPDFTSDEKVVIDIHSQQLLDGHLPPKNVPIHDGRELQMSEKDGSDDFESRFFHRHGFVLLTHKSNVKN